MFVVLFKKCLSHKRRVSCTHAGPILGHGAPGWSAGHCAQAERCTLLSSLESYEINRILTGVAEAEVPPRQAPLRLATSIPCHQDSGIRNASSGLHGASRRPADGTAVADSTAGATPRAARCTPGPLCRRRGTAAICWRALAGSVHATHVPRQYCRYAIRWVFTTFALHAGRQRFINSIVQPQLAQQCGASCRWQGRRGCC